MTEQAVLVHLPARGAGAGLAVVGAVEGPVAAAVRASGAGEYDGHEIGPDGVVLYLYGPDADRLFLAAAPALPPDRLPPGSYAVKRYGPPGARAARVELRKR